MVEPLLLVETAAMASEGKSSAAPCSIDFTITNEELAWLASLSDGLPLSDRQAHAVDALDSSQRTESDTANMRSDADWRIWGQSTDPARGERSVVHTLSGYAPARSHALLQQKKFKSFDCRIISYNCSRLPHATLLCGDAAAGDDSQATSCMQRTRSACSPPTACQNEQRAAASSAARSRCDGQAQHPPTPRVRAPGVAQEAARRGVQKRRFRRVTGKSAFERDIEVPPGCQAFLSRVHRTLFVSPDASADAEGESLPSAGWWADTVILRCVQLFKHRLAWEDADAQLHRAANLPDGVSPRRADAPSPAPQLPLRRHGADPDALRSPLPGMVSHAEVASTPSRQGHVRSHHAAHQSQPTLGCRGQMQWECAAQGLMRECGADHERRCGPGAPGLRQHILKMHSPGGKRPVDVLVGISPPILGRTADGQASLYGIAEAHDSHAGNGLVP